MTDMVVSGAGTSAVNGTYVENGTSLEGVPKYEKGIYTIIWDSDNEYWYITENASTILYGAPASYPPVSPDITSAGYWHFDGAPPRSHRYRRIIGSKSDPHLRRWLILAYWHKRHAHLHSSIAKPDACL